MTALVGVIEMVGPKNKVTGQRESQGLGALQLEAIIHIIFTGKVENDMLWRRSNCHFKWRLQTGDLTYCQTFKKRKNSAKYLKILLGWKSIIMLGWITHCSCKVTKQLKPLPPLSDCPNSTSFEVYCHSILHATWLPWRHRNTVYTQALTSPNLASTFNISVSSIMKTILTHQYLEGMALDHHRDIAVEALQPLLIQTL